MATTNEELRVRLLDAKKAESELRGVRKELEKVSGTTTASGKSAAKAAESHGKLSGALGSLKHVLTYGGGLVGFAAVGYGLKDITEGGIKAQEQQVLLQNALQATGQAGKGHMAAINEAITKSTATGGFSDLEEKGAISSLIRETGSYTKAIKDNQLAITLARGAHEGYQTAISQVERVQTGQVGRLQKLLGIIQPVKYYEQQLTAEQKKRFPEKLKDAQLLDKEATAREANRRILERYGSSVAAYNKSTAGSIQNANNAFKNATDQLGEKLLPAETAVAKAFAGIITEMSKGEGIWKTVGKDISLLGKDFERLAKAGEWFYNTLIKPIPKHGVIGDVAGFLSGGIVGNPETAPLALGEDVFGGGGHHAAKPEGVHKIVGRYGGNTVELPNSTHLDLTQKLELHVDAVKIAEAIAHNKPAVRRLAEAQVAHVLGKKARE